MSRPALSVQNLTKEFALHNPTGELAVGGISFEVPEGEIYGLLGGNGAGKTTTMAMLCGILRPTSGSITILGRSMPDEQDALLPEINFSSPYVDLPGNLTVKQNLTVYAKLYNIANSDQKLEELAETFNIGEFFHKPYSRLSAGQKTRVSLAKSFLNTPKLLLLDEPTASLDPENADWIRGLLERYVTDTNATILLTSHNMFEVERLCKNICIMSRGTITDRGTPKALVKKYGRKNLEEVFLDVARGNRDGAAA